MTHPGRAGPRRRGAARATWLLGLLTLLVTPVIAYRTPGALLDALSPPWRLTQAEANLAGLLSLDLMLLQTLGLARLPWLEAAWGHDLLTRRHRALGWWSFWLMAVHVLLFTLQRTQRHPGRVGVALADLFWREPGMLQASLGTGLLVLVVLTSAAGVRGRLAYEHWHLVHLWAYVGMGLALPHLLVAADFATPWVNLWWWSLYLLTLAAVVAFRVVLPLARSRRLAARVTGVERTGPTAVTVTVGGRGFLDSGTRSGQFFVWRFLGARHPWRGHPYSLSAAPTDHELRVTVEGTGDDSRSLAQVREGSRVMIEGPYGVPAATRRRHPHLVLLAAGSGITPFRSLLEDAELGPGSTTLVHRVSDARHRLLAVEVDRLCVSRGIDMIVLAGPRRALGSWLPQGREGEPQEVLRSLAPDLLDADVVVCGPAGWTGAVHDSARRAGVRLRDLHVESFSSW